VNFDRANAMIRTSFEARFSQVVDIARPIYIRIRFRRSACARVPFVAGPSWPY